MRDAPRLSCSLTGAIPSYTHASQPPSAHDTQLLPSVLTLPLIAIDSCALSPESALVRRAAVTSPGEASPPPSRAAVTSPGEASRLSSRVASTDVASRSSRFASPGVAPRTRAAAVFIDWASRRVTSTRRRHARLPLPVTRLRRCSAAQQRCLDRHRHSHPCQCIVLVCGFVTAAPSFRSRSPTTAPSALPRLSRPVALLRGLGLGTPRRPR